MGSSRMETILKICEILSQEEDITNTFKETAKGTGITSLATLTGALLLGRKGLIAGSIIGGVASYLLGSEFKSGIEIFRNMSSSKKRQLYQSVDSLMADVPLDSVAAGLAYLAAHGDVKTAVQSEISCFLGSQISGIY